MVEWKKLGEIGEVCMCKRIMKEQTSGSGEIPFFKIGTFGAIADSFISKELFEDYKSRFSYPKKGEILISASGTIGRSVIFDGKDAYFQDSNIVWISNDESVAINKYLYYCYQIVDWKVDGGTIKRLYNYNLKNAKIPVPPFSEQYRIVEILDTFTASVENLKQQITERRKQFEHYRDQLLDLKGKEGVEMKTLGELGKCYAGATPSTKNSSYWKNGIIPWMSSGEVHQGIVTHTASFITQKGYNNASTRMLPVGTVVIALAGQGKTRGSVAITAIELCTNQSLCGVVIDDVNILNKYIYFYLKTRYNDLRRISSGDGTRGGLNLKMIGSYNIPVLSLSEQSRIVSILDTFEASIANLEAQLELREKQYEYYRNKLLTFE